MQENVNEEKISLNCSETNGDNMSSSELICTDRNAGDALAQTTSKNESNLNMNADLQGVVYAKANNSSVGTLNKQQSLEEELLMEDELLKGEEDEEIDSNLNTEDLMLDDDNTISQTPVVVQSSSEFQKFEPSQQNNGSDLDVNIDSLLGSTSGAPDSNLDLEVDEAELLNEDDTSNDREMKNETSAVNNQMVYDEDSLLKELDGNGSEDVVLDDNVDSLLSGDSKTVVNKEIDEKMSTNDNETLPENKFGDVGECKDTPMENFEVDLLLGVNNDVNENISKDISTEPNTVDSSTIIENKSIPMEENSLQLNDVDTGQEDNMTTDEDVEIDTIKDDGKMEKDDIEQSENIVDENKLLDEESEDNFDPALDETSINENILLSDTDNTTSAQVNNLVEAKDSLMDCDINLNENNCQSSNDGNEIETDLNGENMAGNEIESTDSQTGFEIKIDSVISGNVESVTGASNAILTTSENDGDFGSLSDENLDSNLVNSEMNHNSQTVVEEFNDQIEKPANETIESELNENSESLLRHEEILLSNDFPENEIGFEESLVKEEVLENEFEEDYLEKEDEQLEGGTVNQDYELGDAVVKEEMADIETLVDVKQEMEETDHLALDHNMKQEYLDPDSIKEEYSGDDVNHAYFSDEKDIHDKMNYNEVVPIALNKSSEFRRMSADDNEEMIVPASMISAAEIQNMQSKKMNSKDNEEIIISDKCVDVANLQNIAMDVENEVDSLLAPRSFACSICHREYQTISSLQRHEKIHISEGGVEDSNQMENSNVANETLSNLVAVEGMYNCNCGKSFKRRSSVVACLKTHRVRGIWCEYCDVHFRRQRELRSHILRVHTNSAASKSIKKPKCTICNKEFAHQRSLIRHSKLHLKDAKLPDETTAENHNAADGSLLNCDLCNLGFGSDSELSTHKSIAHPLTATGDSPTKSQAKEAQPLSLKLKFNCKYCKKVFLTLGALSSHKALHSKKSKMKFRCERCQESFQTRSELSSHRRLHCRGVLHHYSALQYIADREVVKVSKQVKCNVCAQMYANKEDMETHRDTTHPFVTFSKEDATETRIFFK